MSKVEKVDEKKLQVDVRFDEDDDEMEIGDLVSEELRALDNAADAILDSIRKEALDTPPHAKKKTKSFDSYGSFDEDEGMVGGDDDDDFATERASGVFDHDEDMQEEIMRLNDVVASLKQEMDSQSVDTMTSALSNMDSTPQAYRYSSNTVLTAEATDFIRRNKLYGPGVGGAETNTPLLLFTLLVWGALVFLTLHLQNGGIDSSGEFVSVPETLQKLIDRLFF